MGVEKSAGLLFVVLGLIFIIFPVFSSSFVSIVVGLSLLFFGISAAFTGFNMRRQLGYIGIATMLIGIIAIIFGFLFIFYIDALSFLISLQFYIIGFLMILFGITGLLSKSARFSAFTSILILIMGIVAIALAVFALNEPIYIAIIIGLVLIIEGLAMIMD